MGRSKGIWLAGLISLLVVFSLLVSQVFATEDIVVKQVDTSPKIDDVVDPADWFNATKISAYFIDRFTGKKFEDLSEIWIQQHENILYVAFKYYDSKPEDIVANMKIDQSDITKDDCFGVVIDPFHNHSDISWFCLNAIGTKMWHISGGTASKVEWAGGFFGDARVTEEGWEGEMGIDLSKLPRPKDISLVGINFDRRQQRLNLFGDWQQVGVPGHNVHDIQKEKMGHLKGLQVTDSGLVMSVMPYFFLGQEYDYEEEKWEFAHREGGDIKIPFANSMTFVSSILSDEENVEGDVERVIFDYAERYVPDRRPFWQEGSGYRQTYGAFHSGRIGRTHVGASVFGKPTARTSTAVLASYNREEGTVSILSGGASFGAKTGSGFTIVNHSGRDTSLIHGGMGTQAGKGNWFSTGGNITVLNNRQENVVGERYLQHITLNFRGFTFKTVPYYTSEDYLNPIGYERYIGVYGSRTYAWFSFKHEEEGFWGRIFKESSIGTQNETGNYTEAKVFRRTFGMNANVTTRSDHYLDISLSGGQYAVYDDGTILITFKGRKSDPKTNFGVVVESGWRQEESMLYVAPYGSLNYKGLTGSLEIARLWHVENLNLYQLTFGYDFTPEIGIYGRGINRNNDVNIYFGFRKSGYIGTELHIIVGGPNRIEEQTNWIQKRVLLKVLRSFNIKF